MSHQIPHQIQKQTLISPASCSACNKFIWGIGKESYICLGEKLIKVFFLKNINDNGSNNWF